MTQDEIIEMWNSVIKYAPSEVRIAEFAKLVAAKEREACALICDDHHEIWRFGEGEYSASGPKDCAVAIRARWQE